MRDLLGLLTVDLDLALLRKSLATSIGIANEIPETTAFMVLIPIASPS